MTISYFIYYTDEGASLLVNDAVRVTIIRKSLNSEGYYLLGYNAGVVR
jgi:hypothetical protein